MDLEVLYSHFGYSQVKSNKKSSAIQNGASQCSGSCRRFAKGANDTDATQTLEQQRQEQLPPSVVQRSVSFWKGNPPGKEVTEAERTSINISVNLRNQIHANEKFLNRALKRETTHACDHVRFESIVAHQADYVS